MLSANFRRNAKIPAAAFMAVAVLIGLALLALQIVLRMELMAPELQYLCAEGGSNFCFAKFDQAITISRAPLTFLVSVALVPAFLAGLGMRLHKIMPPHIMAWVVAAMWLAFAFYLAVPITSIYSPLPLSGWGAQNEWTLYPSLSSSPSSYQPNAILNSLEMNKVAIAILLILNLFGFAIAGLTRLRSTPSKVLRIGFATLMILVIWVLVVRLSDFLKFISMDRNSGTAFFDPVLRSDNDYPTRLLEYYDSLEIWYVAMALCCSALWLLARRS